MEVDLIDTANMVDKEIGKWADCATKGVVDAVAEWYNVDMLPLELRCRINDTIVSWIE